jgi:hypothetical protein
MLKLVMGLAVTLTVLLVGCAKLPRGMVQDTASEARNFCGSNPDMLGYAGSVYKLRYDDADYQLLSSSMDQTSTADTYHCQIKAHLDIYLAPNTFIKDGEVWNHDETDQLSIIATTKYTYVSGEGWQPGTPSYAIEFPRIRSEQDEDTGISEDEAKTIVHDCKWYHDCI